MFDEMTRMVLFLFWVGFLGEFPLKLTRRIGGCSNWNRHTQYNAKKLGYIEIVRHKLHGHVLRSARLTQAGLDYVCSCNPEAGAYLLAKGCPLNCSNRVRDVARAHALSIGQMMAALSGSIVLPDQKPSLLLHKKGPAVKIDPSVAYYYTTSELRLGIEEFDPSVTSKTSRILGVIVRGSHCYCLYHTGHSRMYWVSQNEHNIIDSIETLLLSRGFKCTEFSQVLISDKMCVAESIARQNINCVSKYFTVSDSFAHTYFITNDHDGDALLTLIVNPEADLAAKRRYLTNYSAPSVSTRSYDAVTSDGLNPVILGYHFDLLHLLTLDEAPDGFRYRPILLCYEYQVNTIQRIVGHQIDVRSIEEDLDE